MSWCLRRMFCEGLHFPHRTITQAASASVTQRSSDAGAWHLYSAVCLERLPVVAPPLSDMEQRFATLLRRLEFESSLKSDHEIRHVMDLATAEALRVSEGDDPDLVEAASVQTAADFEDACAEELAGFKAAPTVTEADRTGDQRSLERQLASSLVLVVRQRLGGPGGKPSWMLPHGRHAPGETMIQTAERTLRTLAGPNLTARFLGNAPWGFYKYKYPKALQHELGAVGGKVFFYKAVLSGGAVEPAAGGDVEDYRWLTGSELRGQLRSPYYRSVRRILVDQD